METIKLQDEFIKLLHWKGPKRSELVKTISDVLKIELEPASRRLNGKVQFSLDEMGVLARYFSISIDSILHRNTRFQWMPFVLQAPMEKSSMESLVDIMKDGLLKLSAISKSPSELNIVTDTLPVEFFMYHSYLMKFMFFKWGYYFIGTDEFNSFGSWILPKQFLGVKGKYENVLPHVTKITYIWDNALIWILAKEIDFFYQMHILTVEEREMIRKDIHELLFNLEKCVKGKYSYECFGGEVHFYISNIHHGISSWCHSSEKKCAFFFKTNFSHTPVSEDRENLLSLKEWIYSLRKISTLISDSGEIDRKLYFEEQHQIVDLILANK